MSTTTIAFTIVGSKVNRRDFFRTVESNIHDDCMVTGPGPMCSACGKPLADRLYEDVPIDGFEPEGGSESQGQIGGLHIVPVRNGYDTDHFLAAHWVESWSLDTRCPEAGPQKMDLFSLASAEERVRGILLPLGLWKPENFGIWTALYLGG